jgi:hypothetical protein
MNRIKKLATAAATALALTGVVLSTAAAAQPNSAPASGTAAQPATKVLPVPSVSRGLGQGVMGHTTWSAKLVYYPTTPANYSPGHNPKGLVCIAVTIDGKSTGGYGAVCDGVTGPHDTSTDLGMYGQNTYAGGAGLFFAQPTANVASATMTFSNGRPVTVEKVTIPGTDFSAYVIPVAAHLDMKGLNEYDSHHHLVSHQDF